MYDGLANFYNKYTADIDYGKLADFAERCFAKFGNSGIKALSKKKKTKGAPTDGTDIGESLLVLDCACGTGTLTCELAARGYDMTGLDISQEMLDRAMERAGEMNLDIMWLCQDMTKINLYGAYSAILCMTDSINHLTTEKKLKSFFERIYNFTDAGGLVIFDFLTEDYFKNRVGSNVFFEDGDEGSCLWTSEYNEKTGICRYDIVAYTLADEGSELYERADDTVREKSWSMENVREAAENAGYEICGFYNNLSLKQAFENCGRVYAVVKRPEWDVRCCE